jgi:hypothetical protein
MSIKNLKKRYDAPTPQRWIIVGDSISLLGTTLTATLATIEVHHGWIIASAILTWFGQTVVKFASPLPKNEPEE